MHKAPLTQKTLNQETDAKFPIVYWNYICGQEI